MSALRGADQATVEAAIASADPLPGTAGFAGRLPDGTLVRDVLGREPCFHDGDRWSADPTALESPTPLPAGCVRRESGTEQVWSLPSTDPLAPDAALSALREALATTLPDRGRGAVAFSGGVDSALLATAVDGPLYVAGFPDGHDVAAARAVADRLGRSADLRVVELDHDDLREAVRAVVRATGRTNAMDVGIAVPLRAVARRAAADGHRRLYVGQGADELFGGYAKVARAPTDDRVAAETVRGARDEVLASLPDQAARDVPVLRAAGVDPVTPYLHDRVVRAALSLPGSLLVDGETRKVALRAVAADRLPADVADRPKKAMQYGSLVAREMDRLARRDGFKRRQDDHVSRWVASLVDA